MSRKLIACIMVATFACITTSAAARPLGVYPAQTRKICQPMKKLINQQLKGQLKGTHRKKADTVILDCLGDELAYIEKAYQNAHDKALAKVGDIDKLDEMVGMSDFGIGDGGGEDVEWQELLPYKSSLVKKLLLTLAVAEPAVQYPSDVISLCNKPKEGHQLADPCLSYKAEYMRGVMEHSLKIILEHSKNPQAVEAEQKLWKASDICDANYNADPAEVAEEEDCNNRRLILRAAELERQAKKLESGNAASVAQ